MPPKTVIHGIGTAVPDQWKYQKDILEFLIDSKKFHATTASETKKRDDFLRAVYKGSMIEKRHITAPVFSDPILTEKNIRDTMKLHRDSGISLAIEASHKAMIDAVVKKEDIKKVIFVSSTGLTVPGIESMLIEELGLTRDIMHCNIIFSGCAASITALTSAQEFCITNPELKCLIVSLEMFSFHIGKGNEKDEAVPTSLFSDGCAAVVMSGEYGKKAEGKWVIEGNYSYLIPDSSTAIMVNLMDKGIVGTLESKLPSVVKKELPGFMKCYYSKFGIDHVDHWCIHPGGPAIIKAAQTSLDVPEEKLKHSWECLKQYGNMGAATILFVLDRMRRYEASKTDDNMIMLAFGPGLWVESLFLIKQ